MTISSTNNRNDYTGNDTTAIYNYSFRVFLESDLTVTVRNTTTDVETELSLTTDYTVQDVGELSGGTITLVDAGQDWISGTSNLDTGYKLTIRRIVGLTQNTDIRNQGDFFPEVHEDAFDRLTMTDQQQQDDLDRAIKLPETIASSEFDTTIPADFVGTESLALVSNSAGDGFATGPSVDAIEGAQAAATAAAASAAAAATSETNAATSETNAGTSETNAATSETNAAASAAAASTSETNAATSASNAATSETNAGTSETNAAASAAAASTSETNAATSASNAATSETNAATSASNAATSETNAATSATNAATSEANAAASATAAQDAAAASQWKDVVYITNVDSPVSITDADSGKLYSVNTSGGNVVFNLPAISGLTLVNPWSIGIKKTDTSANTITINPNGTDVIDGNASATISQAEAGLVVIPDVDPAPDEWTTLNFGEVPSVFEGKTFNDEITMKEIATPSAPAAGFQAIFMDSGDNKLKRIDSNGDVFGVGGGAGDADTIHLIKASDQGASEITQYSVDSALPDFDGTSAFGANEGDISVPTSGSEALLSNDDDHKVYKYTSEADSRYSAFGINLAIPRYARGEDTVLQLKYRTADTSGDSENADYMPWIFDQTNGVNTTFAGTAGEFSAGTSVTLSTTTGMAVGDKIWIGQNSLDNKTSPDTILVTGTGTYDGVYSLAFRPGCILTSAQITVATNRRFNIFHRDAGGGTWYAIIAYDALITDPPGSVQYIITSDTSDFNAFTNGGSYPTLYSFGAIGTSNAATSETQYGVFASPDVSATSDLAYPTKLLESHITAIPSAGTVQLADDVTCASGTRFITGILTDVLTTFDAADDDTDKTGTDYKVVFRPPSDCAEVTLMFQQLTAQTDSFLYVDNILVSSEVVKKVFAQGERQYLNYGEIQSSHQDRSGEIRFSTSLTDSSFTGPQILRVEDDSANTRTKFVANKECIVDISYFCGPTTASYYGSIYKNGAVFISGSAIYTTGAGSTVSAQVPLSKGDYLSVGISGDSAQNSGFFSTVNMSVTPEVNDVVVVESADSVISEWTNAGAVTIDAVTTAPTKGSTSVDNLRWRRIGDSMEIRVEFRQTSGGAAGSGVYLFRLPEGYQADLSKIEDTTIEYAKHVGSGMVSSNLATQLVLEAYLYDENSIALVGTNEASRYNVDSGTYGLTASDYRLSFSATVPIAGWDANPKPLLSFPTVTYGQDAEVFRATDGAVYASSNTALPYFQSVHKNTISNFGTITNDSTNGFYFTASKRCKVSGSVGLGFTAAGGIGWTKNCTATELDTAITGSIAEANVLGYTYQSTANAPAVASFVDILEPGDIVYAHAETGRSVTTSAKDQFISLLVEPEEGQQNQAAIIAQPVAYCRFDSASTRVTVGSNTTVTLDVLDGDIAAVGVSLSSNDFTLPAGKYEIDYAFYMWANGTGYTVGNCQLYNVTDSKVEHYGLSAGGDGSNGGTYATSSGSTLVTITKSTTFRIRANNLNNSGSHVLYVGDGLSNSDKGYVKITRKK